MKEVRGEGMASCRKKAVREVERNEEERKEYRNINAAGTHVDVAFERTTSDSH